MLDDESIALADHIQREPFVRLHQTVGSALASRDGKVALDTARSALGASHAQTHLVAVDPRHIGTKHQSRLGVGVGRHLHAQMKVPKIALAYEIGEPAGGFQNAAIDFPGLAVEEWEQARLDHAVVPFDPASGQMPT